MIPTRERGETMNARIACAEKKRNGVLDFVYTLEKMGKPV
jgi:hypothetical protein